VSEEPKIPLKGILKDLLLVLPRHDRRKKDWVTSF
jgi:hypothetical protein